MIIKEYIYKDNLIIEYEDGTFLATKETFDLDIIAKECKSLDDAKKFIDKNIFVIH